MRSFDDVVFGWRGVTGWRECSVGGGQLEYSSGRRCSLMEMPETSGRKLQLLIKLRTCCNDPKHVETKRLRDGTYFICLESHPKSRSKKIPNLVQPGCPFPSTNACNAI